MRRGKFIQIAMIMLLIINLVAYLPLVRADKGGNDNRPNSFVINVQPGTDVAAIAGRFNLRLIGQQPNTNNYLLAATNDTSDRNLLRKIAKISGVVSIENNVSMSTPVGSLRQPQGFPGSDPIVLGTDVSVYQSQQLVSFLALPATHQYSRGAGIKVAVIDTGIDFQHPQLTGHIAEGGFDFVDNDQNPNDEPGGGSYGHGTFISGLILLMAPQAVILPIRVMNPAGTGDSFNVATAIRYAVDHGAQVINLSLGTDEQPEVVKRAISYAHDHEVVVTAAMGNNNSGASNIFPANFNETMAIAATTYEDKKASFSNFGQAVLLTAPGVDLISAFPGGRYARWSGTSFSTAVVSGESALVFGIAPNQRRDDVIKAIRETAVALDEKARAAKNGSESDGSHTLGDGRIAPLPAVQFNQGNDD